MGKKFGKRVILNKINLDINSGELFGIIGMSGSGKTTFLNSLIGYHEPDIGDVFYYSFKDRQYKSIYTNQAEVCRLFGFATQTDSFYPKLTLFENLKHFGSLYNMSKKTRTINAERLLRLTELYPFKDELAQNLSEGMKKRLGIACALVHNPKVLLLDEPTANLDPILRKDIWNVIKGIHKM
ncbi:ABC transporter ATP-binding protein [Candidatus Woesearchaeota archaeon]|nr:ABC transporter ATP-binding protein [Candidatus Woesearchaeota archaeon]